MKKPKHNYRILLSMAFAVLFSMGTLFGQLSCYNIVGYFPSWQGAASAIDYSKYTHINYSFGIPNTNGTIGAIENSSKLVDLVNRGHAANVKVLLAIGGWLSTSPTGTPFETIATNSSYITQFVNSCANLVTQYNLDGIDIDWEYPTSQARWNSIMTPLGTRLHSMGKLLTAAVAGGSYYGANFGTLSMLDLVNIMAYDCNCPTNSPYSFAVEALNYWTSRGVTQSKRILGVPFYSTDNYTSLHVQKANLAKSSGGGIMIWEISSPGDIGAIASTLGTLCKGGTTPPPPISTCGQSYTNIPATIQAESYCAMSGVQTESTSDAGGGQNVGWIDAGDWMAYSINVPSSGSYTIQYRVASLSGGGSIRCENYGGGSVYGTISVPSTGGWQTWRTISHTVQLAAGQQTIALAAPAGGFNLNWIYISGGTTPPPAGTVTVQAESYTQMSGVQLETTSDAGGGQNVGWIDAGDWMIYPAINIPTAGTYTIEYRVASQNGGGSIRFETAGGSPVYGTISVPATGGWQNWTTIKHTVTLSAGSRQFAIAAPAGGFNINWWAYTPGVKAAEDINVDFAQNMVIYPNPATDYLYIEGLAEGNYQFKVFDMVGKLQLTKQSSESVTAMDISSLSKGIYMLVTTSDDGSVKSMKFAKE